MLTGDSIQSFVQRGKFSGEKKLVIEPFDPRQVNPNSYNLCLHPELFHYEPDVLLDLKKDPLFEGRKVRILEDGFMLLPGHLYLGSTVEHTETHGLIPCIEGRSSIARYGIEIHISAGFGDIGFCGHWTLEITCVVPVRIYAGIEICQISYHEPSGRIAQTYNGKYQNDKRPEPSKLHQELT